MECHFFPQDRESNCTRFHLAHGATQTPVTEEDGSGL